MFTAGCRAYVLASSAGTPIVNPVDQFSFATLAEAGDPRAAIWHVHLYAIAPLQDHTAAQVRSFHRHWQLMD